MLRVILEALEALLKADIALLRDAAHMRLGALMRQRADLAQS